MTGKSEVKFHSYRQNMKIKDNCGRAMKVESYSKHLILGHRTIDSLQVFINKYCTYEGL